MHISSHNLYFMKPWLMVESIKSELHDNYTKHRNYKCSGIFDSKIYYITADELIFQSHLVICKTNNLVLISVSHIFIS